METNVIIPPPLVAAADELAHTLGLTRDELVVLALDTFIESHQRSDLTYKLDEVYGAEPSDIDPLIARLQSASISRDEW